MHKVCVVQQAQRFGIRRAEVQTWSLVLLMNFSNKLKLCALKPARTQSPETLAVIVTDDTTTST